MYIEQISISNYKGFNESGLITFTPGFNVIVGANNSGKTALVEALSLQFTDRPHRSQRTIPRPGARTTPHSSVAISFHLDAGETGQVLMDTVDNFVIPSSPGGTPQNMAEHYLGILMKQPDSFRSVFQQGGFSPGLDTSYLSSIGPISGTNIGFEVNREKQEIRYTANSSGNVYNINLSNAIRQRIYAFKAERLKVGEGSPGPRRQLAPDASNLVEVIHNLQSNPPRYERFNRLVTEIFPEIGLVTAPIPISGSGLTPILLWPVEFAKTERDDLAIPLSESGTGIGQVLAILYVVLTSDYPQTIIIDEPQSFLNPGATRKLIDILKQHQQHQFIMTTHSPEVITAASPCRLFLLKKEDAQTQIAELNAEDAQDLRIILSEVGARLSDVFGADHMLWVEGPTEELCFPLIVEKVLKKRLMGTKIVGVLQTGDFETSDLVRIARIYSRLSKGSSLLPPAIGFIFDREGRAKQKRDDIERIIRQAGSTVKFTERRMYESYLLNPEAIAAVTSTIEDFRSSPVTVEEVRKWVDDHRGDPDFFEARTADADRAGDNWIRNVDAAKVLARLFSEFSEQRILYDKKEHGVALTQWLIEYNPADLEEMAHLLESFLPSVV